MTRTVMLNCFLSWAIYQLQYPDIHRVIGQYWSWSSSVIIVTRLYIGCADEGTGLDTQQRQYFSLLHNDKTYSGVHPASYPIGAGRHLPQV
jgi:hypothetical protein